MSDDSDSSSCGCGCFSIIILILILWALLFGLPINNKVLNIDIFPPAVTYE